MARWNRSEDGEGGSGPSRERSEPLGSEERPDPTRAGDPWIHPSTAPPIVPPAPFGPPPPPGRQGGPDPVSPWAPPPGAYSTIQGTQALQYGRTLDRVMAYLLDGLIVSIPVVIVAFGLGMASVLGRMQEGGLTLVAGIVGSGVHLLYFVTFWTGSGQATPGMRLMKLRIGDARTGAVPTVQQGLIRWLALGGIFQVIELVPPLLPIGVLASFVWELILLATTASSPTKQGLHDRIANTALAQPAAVQTPAVTCLVIVVALFALCVVAGVLVLLSTSFSGILSAIGTSV